MHVALEVKSLTDTTQGVLLLLLTLVAVALALIGMWRAFFGRTRTQLVIDDIVRAEDVPASLTVGLSSDLRRAVRRQLEDHKAPGGGDLTAVLRNDVLDDLAVIDNIRESVPLPVDGAAAELPGRHERRREKDKDRAVALLAHIVRKIEEAPGREVLNKQHDELGALTGGLGALAPGQASGFTAALAAVLPQQRGLHVSVTAVTSETDQQVQTGLTVEVGGLERAADASATFWTRGRPVDGSGQRHPVARTEFEGLIEPAANWITIHVIGRLAIGGDREPRWLARSWRRLLAQTHLPGSRRVRTHDQQRGLRALLTAEWASWAMDNRPDEPQIALGFSAQACDDAGRAAAVLRRYYLPHYVLGTLHDHTACCYRNLSRSAQREDIERTYRNKATAAYAAARSAFAHAEERLRALGSNRIAQQYINDIEIDRLKADVLANGAAALPRLDAAEVRARDARTRYNAACLYSAAAVVARAEQLPDDELESHARTYLTEALLDPVEGAEAISHAVKEPDLLDGLTEQLVGELAGAAADIRAGTITPDDLQRLASALGDATPGNGDPEALAHARRTVDSARATAQSCVSPSPSARHPER